MTQDQPQFELPKRIERYLAALSRLYAQEGERQLQELIVNSRVRVQEAWTSDGWDGGSYGHALFLVLPGPLFLAAVKNKGSLQQRIAEDLNRLHSHLGEFIAQVFLEIDDETAPDWRAESGLLIGGQRIVTPVAATRIWGEGFRVFLSHKAEVKVHVGTLKARLRLYGVSGFVAHEDIHPTREWQEEIELALGSMDAFVALMTDGFHDSLWTDQEVGFAVGRSVPIVSVRLGADPYGFLGKYQALSCPWDDAAQELVKLFIANDRMTSAFVEAAKRCRSFEHGNMLAGILPHIQRLSTEQAQDLLAAYRDNAELQGSFGFNGARAPLYGQGLSFHLKRLGLPDEL